MKNFKTEWYKDIEEVITHFNAERVHKVMRALDWVWHDYDGIPAEHEIKYELKNLILDCANRMLEDGRESFIMMTRGFSVETKRYFDDDKLYINVSFEVVTFDNHY